jgi:arabinogalactan endo-1,4-beta-galactosidase
MKAWSYLILLILAANLMGQDFYLGNDLSYVNQMEDCGGDFKENGVSKDVYQIFADRGNNLVRVRLWVDPTWQNPLEQPAGVKDQYSDYTDVRETIMRSKQAGMQVLLDFHLSDAWADPGRQAVPARWRDVAYNLTALKDSVYNYVVKVLSDLERDTLMPEFVQIGNETNPGILVHEYIDYSGWWSTGPVVSNDWSRHAQLFNTAIKAVRDVSDTTVIKPKIALHCAGLSTMSWWYSNIISKGVTDFDIMGVSYYYDWHGGSIGQIGDRIRSLLSDHPGYDAMVLETGYLWTTKDFDNNPNIITKPDPRYLPVIPEKQLEYMVDLIREVKRAGGIGVVFWESAWISTPCRTAWAKGSQHDHVVYFDPDSTNFMENGGGRWMESHYYNDLSTKKVSFKVDMTGQDVSNGVYITGSFTGDEWQILPMADLGNNIYYYWTYLTPGETGGYYILNDNNFDAREVVPAECADWSGTDRQYTMAANDTTILSYWGDCQGPDEIFRLYDFRKDNIAVYPNPSNGNITVRFKLGDNTRTLQIVDLNSKLLLEFEIMANESERIIDLSDLNPGVYILRMRNNQISSYKKIVRF